MNTNEGASGVPDLRVYLNLSTLNELPDWSKGPDSADDNKAAVAIRAAGYTGVQGEDVGHWRDFELAVTTLGRVNAPTEIAPMVSRWKDEGYDTATLHVGWGFEDDEEVDALVESVLDASEKYRFPLFIETHRATVTQDPWRTLQIVERHPSVRFNGDFSHWYTGLEFVYGDFEHKLDLIAPVFERVGFMHGRVGNGGHIQVPLTDPSMTAAVKHYEEMWTRAMAGFLSVAAPGDYLIFAPEVLRPSINYARLCQRADGTWDEDSDRWLEAIELGKIARSCFERARDRVNAAP